MSDFTFLPQLPQDITVLCILHAIGFTSENIDCVETEEAISLYLLDTTIQLKSVSTIARVCKSWNQLLNEKESPGKIIWKKLHQLCLWKSPTLEQMAMFEDSKFAETASKLNQTIFKSHYKKFTNICQILRFLQAAWIQCSYARLGQLFSNLGLYTKDGSMPDLPFEDLSQKLLKVVVGGFRQEQSKAVVVFASLKRLAATYRLHFKAEQLTESEDPELRNHFSKDSISSWNCPPSKQECMMNTVTLIGFIWVHSSYIDLHFGQLMHAIWTENKQKPVEWSTYVEEIETDLLMKTLELYKDNFSPVISKFIQTTYSLARVWKNQDIQQVYQYMKPDNPENLPTLVGLFQFQLASEWKELVVGYKSKKMKVILKEPIPSQIEKLIQLMLHRQYVFIKLKGHMKENNVMVDAVLMEMVAVPTDRFVAIS